MMLANNKAMIVDDEPGIRYFVSACLDMLGFECSEAGSGEESLDLASEANFDVIFMDVRMPGMGGLEAIRSLRNQGCQAKIIVLSALGGPEIAAAAVTEIGANAFLSKPCTVSQVQQAVEHLGAVPAA